jgi:LCP family protein required for cell wall assembly
VNDRTESLIRDAFAAEADRAPDPRTVLAGLARARPPRRRGMALVSAAVVVVVVAIAAVVVPRVLDRGVPPAGPAPAEDQNVLLIGLDRSRYADAMMLAHLDADGTAAVVSLPRDTWVRSPASSVDRLNQVYAKDGIDALLTEVRTLTGVAVEHYALLDMAAFGDLATAVGGVPVCLKEATTDPTSGASFPAGRQTIEGARALAFVRQRHSLSNGDLDRVVRQQVFLDGLATRLRDTDPAAVLAALGAHLRTDKDLDVLGLAAQLKGVGDLRYATVPVAEESHHLPNGALVLRLDPAAVARFVAGMFSGPGGSGSAGGAAPAGGTPCVS